MNPLSHQVAPLAEIVARARAKFAGYGDLPIQPRYHSILCSGSGNGKSFLAGLAATATDSNLLRASASGWIPMGAHNRGATETISVIAKAVMANERTFLAIDEICKICLSDSNGWQGYIRGEIMELADGRWPTGLKMSPDYNDDDNEAALKVLTHKLQNNVFILAIGTFQDWLDGAGSRRTMGFGSENDTAAEITADVIAGKLQREVANRFNSSLIILPELSEQHYRQIARQTEEALPERMRQAFSEAVAARIAGAISAKKGVRFLEEAMLDTLINLPPEELLESPKPILKNPPKTIDPFDQCTL